MTVNMLYLLLTAFLIAVYAMTNSLASEEMTREDMTEVSDPYQAQRRVTETYHSFLSAELCAVKQIKCTINQHTERCA